MGLTCCAIESLTHSPTHSLAHPLTFSSDALADLQRDLVARSLQHSHSIIECLLEQALSIDSKNTISFMKSPSPVDQ